MGPREVADAVRLDIFAAVADDEHGADIRMDAVGQHALHDCLIVQTCERAGDIDVPVLRLKMRRDGLCDVLAALHGVEHEDLVADALAAVRRSQAWQIGFASMAFSSSVQFIDDVLRQGGLGVQR